MKTKMKTLLVAERMNLGRSHPRWVERALRDPTWWFEVSTDLGAYRSEHAVCRPSRRRLEIVGLGRFIDDEGKGDFFCDGMRDSYNGEWEWTREPAHRLNFLPPAECGAWDKALADHLAAHLPQWVHDEGYTHVVVLGKRVASALGFPHANFFDTWTQCRTYVNDSRAQWMLAPHPSGRSYWWNDPENIAYGRAEVENFLRTY